MKTSYFILNKKFSFESRKYSTIEVLEDMDGKDLSENRKTANICLYYYINHVYLHREYILNKEEQVPKVLIFFRMLAHDKY